ncbi:MAG: hypothetical protein GY777_00865 [Candidatus Brocadiaceae bacterium]|nr:hypothetical protein [Candidatus Brocadiaceae bacterium]
MKNYGKVLTRPSIPGAGGNKRAEQVDITKEMTTGEVTEKYPATRAVFAKHFGKSCFDCPAFGTEDIN